MLSVAVFVATFLPADFLWTWVGLTDLLPTTLLLLHVTVACRAARYLSDFRSNLERPSPPYW